MHKTNILFQRTKRQICVELALRSRSVSSGTSNTSRSTSGLLRQLRTKRPLSLRHIAPVPLRIYKRIHPTRLHPRTLRLHPEVASTPPEKHITPQRVLLPTR